MITLSQTSNFRFSRSQVVAPPSPQGVQGALSWRHRPLNLSGRGVGAHRPTPTKIPEMRPVSLLPASVRLSQRPQSLEQQIGQFGRPRVGESRSPDIRHNGGAAVIPRREPSPAVPARGVRRCYYVTLLQLRCIAKFSICICYLAVVAARSDACWGSAYTLKQKWGGAFC
jgi:hypothetical protein